MEFVWTKLFPGRFVFSEKLKLCCGTLLPQTQPSIKLFSHEFVLIYESHFVSHVFGTCSAGCSLKLPVPPHKPPCNVFCINHAYTELLTNHAKALGHQQLTKVTTNFPASYQESGL